MAAALPFAHRASDKLNPMDDEQGQHQPATTRPPVPGGAGRGDDGGDHQPENPGVGDTQITGAATQDGGAGPGAGDGRTGGKARKRQRSFWRELPILIVIALGLTLLIKSFAVQAFYIPSSSMENTLEIGDRVLVNKIVYHLRDIHRGDVVVFSGLDSWDPSVPQTPSSSNPIRRFADWIGSALGVATGEKDYVKRVIGLPGDHVQCCDARGRVTVNGVPLNEQPYLYPGNAPSLIRFDTTVPAGELWVMGDHRAVSYDSRDHRGDPGGGAIPESKVIGRAFVVVWPLDRLAILGIPATFEQKALAAAAPAAPLVLGAAGAVPITLLRRRVRVRTRARRAETAAR